MNIEEELKLSKKIGKAKDKAISDYYSLVVDALAYINHLASKEGREFNSIEVQFRNRAYKYITSGHTDTPYVVTTAQGVFGLFFDFQSAQAHGEKLGEQFKVEEVRTYYA